MHNNYNLFVNYQIKLSPYSTVVTVHCCISHNHARITGMVLKPLQDLLSLQNH